MYSPEYNPYIERAQSLKRLGFQSYDEYLKSQKWREIRRRVLAQRPHCIACTQRASTSVHHSDYAFATMAGETIDTLIPCCGRCHRRAERIGQRILEPRDRIQTVTLLLLSGWSKSSRANRRGRRPVAVWSNSSTWRWAAKTGPATTGHAHHQGGKSKRRQTATIPRDMSPRLVRKSPD